MKNLKQFNIPFVGLKEGNHLFEYQIENMFFKKFNFEDFNNLDVNVTVNLNKKHTIMELFFKAEGLINIPCDVTGVLFDLKIKDSLPLIVKFGNEFNDENEEILIIPHEYYQINVAQYIYELIVLSVPLKRVHPKVIDGTLNSKALKELQPKINKFVERKRSTDPRWDKLKNLLTDK